MGPKSATKTKLPRLSRIESVLLEKGVVSRAALAAAKDRQRGAKRPLLEVLLEQQSVDETELVRIVEQSLGRPALAPEDLTPDADVQSYVSAETAQRLGILPLRLDDGVLILATSDPFQLPAFDEIAAAAQLRVRPEFAPPSAVRKVLRSARLGEEALDEILKHAADEDDDLVFDDTMPESDGELRSISDDDGAGEGSSGAQSLDGHAQDAPVTRLVSMILADGIRQGASDIHIEAEKLHLRVRFRIDGDLREVLTVPASLHDRVLARLKIVCGLDIIEYRRPQDGRAQVALGDANYDLRVSTMPSYFGEKAVIRILDKENRSFELGSLGLDPAVFTQWSGLLRQPNGLMLLTGPTGSGKTTTLYASLLELRESTKNIVTVEDPVEYQFPGIVHVPVHADIGMTFATALRSILRQDPDIVLLGEIRDEETAEVAMRAAQTGHLVLSTLHTNDAVGAISRLRDLGVSPYLLSTCLIGVMSQRLVKTICPSCARPHAYGPEELAILTPFVKDLGLSNTRSGEGCAKCNGTGLRGRTALVELVELTPALRQLVHQDADEMRLMEQAELDGTTSLADSGLRKVLAGDCGPYEVARYGSAGLRRRTAPAQTASIPEPQPDPTTTLVLVCDDDRVQRKLLAHTLDGEFDEIEKAKNGQEALDAIARRRPDLLIIDQNMPEMTGVEAIRRLRSSLQTVGLPILMLSGDSSEELELEALDAGADDYLAKPIEPERLLSRVRAIVASRRRVATAGG